jgi:sugar phosphate isomerase/epimerase
METGSMISVGCAALYPITRFGFPYSLDNYLLALAEMRQAGFAACELEINVDLDLEEYERRAAEVHAALAEHGLAIAAVIGVVQQAFSIDAAAADQTLRRFERLCRWTQEAGCDTVCICAYMPKEIEGVPGSEMYRGSPPLQVRVPPGFAWEAFWDNAVARLAQMARAAARYGQRLVIENRVGDFVSTSDGVLRLLEDAGEPNAGCLLDVAHTHATKEHLALVIPKLKRRLMYVHLADNDGTVSRHLPAGRGNVDFPAVFRSLKAVGYDGYANVDFGGVPPDQIWEEARRGREYFERCRAEAGA